MSKPTAVFHWQDSETEAEGWVVLDAIINSVSGGGIFMHPKATLEETADIAKNMTKKFTVTVPQIGGAKAGIRFDHTHSQAKAVLRRFIHAHKLLLESVWVTAGDLNTDDYYIEQVITKELGLSCCQHRLGTAVAEATNKPNLSKNLAKLITTQASEHANLIEATVGYGVSEAIKTALEITDKSLMGKARVIIQGFGAVGSNLAYYLTQRNIAKVVAISDKDGIIHSSEGLPIDLLLQRRINRFFSLEKAGAKDTKLSECSKNCIVNLTENDLNKFNYIAKSSFETNAEYTKAFLSCEKAEIFSPCAFRYCITAPVIDTLVNYTWQGLSNRYVVSGANNPYGVYKNGSMHEDKKGIILEKLIHHKVVVIPDWVSNSGTAQLFHRGMSVAFDMKANDLAQQVLKVCAKPIKSFILDAYRRSQNNPLQIPLECEKKAQHQIQYPIQIGKYVDVESLNPAQSKYALASPKHTLSLEKRYQLVRSVGEECIKEEELKELLRRCSNPVCYDGFEPSGRMHIAQGLLKAVNVNKMTDAGFTYIFWVADWFAQLNHKLGGDLNKIKDVGKYFIEIWKACGMNMDRVVFLWASNEIGKHYHEYMEIFLDIASKTSIKRVKRCMQIMGRSEDKFEEQSASHIVYSCMQCTDIFFLGVDVCQLGMDQRKVNMLAREYAKKVNKSKPVILGHHMLAGLKKGQTKMSKSDPDSAIFMEDTAEDVKRKISKAYCVGGEVENNPCVEYMKYIVFPHTTTIIIKPLEGDHLVYHDYESFEQDFKANKIHPTDLKQALVEYLNQILDPIREHFQKNEYAKSLLEKVKTYRVTK